MNQKALTFYMSLAARSARSFSDEPVAAGRKMRAGKICKSCKVPLPLPHTPVSKRCDFCSVRHHVLMHFRRRSGWHCHFTTESKQKLSKRLTFMSAAKVREMAKRGNGLIDTWDRDGFELDLEIDGGCIWLRLSDEQYLALGGVL